MWAVHGVYSPTAMTELKFVLFPTVMSPVGQLVWGHGTIRYIFRVEPVPVHEDCWLKLMLPLEMMARSAPTLTLALLLGLYVQVDRMRTMTPLKPGGTPVPVAASPG